MRAGIEPVGIAGIAGNGGPEQRERGLRSCLRPLVDPGQGAQRSRREELLLAAGRDHDKTYEDKVHDIRIRMRVSELLHEMGKPTIGSEIEYEGVKIEFRDFADYLKPKNTYGRNYFAKSKMKLL